MSRTRNGWPFANVGEAPYRDLSPDGQIWVQAQAAAAVRMALEKFGTEHQFTRTDTADILPFARWQNGKRAGMSRVAVRQVTADTSFEVGRGDRPAHFE